MGVEDRDRAEAAAGRLARGDRGVVEVAIAAHIIAPGMMAGRTAERESVARVAAGQLIERRERALRRPIGRFPRPRRDRRPRVIAVSAEIGVDAPEAKRPAAPDWKGVADRIADAARGDQLE